MLNAQKGVHLETNHRIRIINIIFLATVFLNIFAGLVGFGNLMPNYTWYLIGSQIVLAIPGAVYLVKEKVPYRDAVCMKLVQRSNILLIILFAFLLSPVLTFINSLSMLFAENTTSELMFSISSEIPFLLSLLVIAIIPAVLEESIYRGIFYNEYRKVNPVAGMLLSAFLFGILHGNFNQFSYAFIMGIIFALTIEATDSIISSMVIHFIINGSSVVVLYLLPNIMIYLERMYYDAKANDDSVIMQAVERIIGGTDFSIDSMFESSTELVNQMTVADVFRDYGSRALICGVIAFFVYRKIAKNTGRWEHVKSLFRKRSEAGGSITSEKRSKKIITIPLIIAIVICISTMVM